MVYLQHPKSQSMDASENTPLYNSIGCFALLNNWYTHYSCISTQEPTVGPQPVYIL